MDISAVSAIFTSIKTATDIARLISESDLTLEKAEFKLKLAELISALADAKIQVSEIQQVLIDKNAEVNNLQEQIAIKKQLTWEQPYYWAIDEEKKEGPFCQSCYDKSRELIRLIGNGEGYWECKVCKNTYMDNRYREEILSAPHTRRIDWSRY